jgi:SAM-dependent methyltransferase
VPPQAPPPRVLADQQTEAFDVEYVIPQLWALIEPHLKVRLDRPSRFLDVGGGNGVFTDRVLDAFPQSAGVIVEPSQTLRERNVPRPSKTLVPGTFQAAALDPGSRFDVIFFNWVLHHFVGDSYAKTQALQRQGLADARSLLTDDGCVVVFENYYPGLLIDDLPSWIIYTLTASRLLTPFSRRLGANTAGVGVCFHSRAAWLAKVVQAGLVVEATHPGYRYGNLTPLKRLLLHMGEAQVGAIIARRG